MKNSLIKVEIGETGFRRIIVRPLMRYLTLTLSAILLVGCAGGGGSVHNPPDQIIAGEATKLKLTFSVWGAGSGDLSRRYTEVVCHYRKTGEQQFHDVPALLISSDQSTWSQN